jgi:malate permease and related proteins
MSLISVFTNNLLPILLLSGAGFTVGRVFQLDPRPLGRVIFYILGPVLIFNLLTTSKLAVGNILLMMGYSTAVMLLVAAIALAIGLLLRLERATLTVVVLTSMFGNNGNYGLPLIAFAFGQAALAYASIYFVTSSILLYTLGVVIASLGHLRVVDALKGLLRVPAIYAILLAVLVIRTGWVLPAPLLRTVELTSAGAVPAMLILLGLEIQKVTLTRNWRALSVPVICRLVIGPAVGMLLAGLFGLENSARNDGTVEAAMPTAVMTTVLAAEYKLDASLVTAIIFVGTVISPLTLTPILYFLMK